MSTLASLSCRNSPAPVGATRVAMTCPAGLAARSFTLFCAGRTSDVPKRSASGCHAHCGQARRAQSDRSHRRLRRQQKKRRLVRTLAVWSAPGWQLVRNLRGFGALCPVKWLIRHSQWTTCNNNSPLSDYEPTRWNVITVCGGKDRGGGVPRMQDGFPHYQVRRISW